MQEMFLMMFSSLSHTHTHRQIKGNCAESFTEYWTCLDYTNLAELRHCRKQQKEFDNCVLEKLGWERPQLGDLSKVTKVATSRPLPENPYHSRPRPEPNPVIDAPLEPAKHGSRLFFWSCCFQLFPVRGRHIGPTGPHNNLTSVLRRMPFLTQPSHFSRLGTSTASSGWGSNPGLLHDRKKDFTRVLGIVLSFLKGFYMEVYGKEAQSVGEFFRNALWVPQEDL
ncbi:hypothetical protein QTP70_005784 [Hemibagrus guttatus]|uniref:NADH dehydrogenase [ubiquinone] 1 alpha subcomplex subunit 8 n=1 Tax=Hemibagrus guttatus TaxID=175788 RepID=A0AAE0QIB5_9TELE|nr:hypothetical protein QTP70_005784 [Hemibagrus guttatus]KAK3549520.1 hypothetical protein QTP86_003622 [Hemibagrus guttatus]